MKAAEVLILGGGFTGRRVASRLLARGCRVVATTRTPGKLAELVSPGAEVLRLDVLERATLACLENAVGRGTLVVHSIPVIDGPEGCFDPTPLLLSALDAPPARVVYLSTTGVYGAAARVDENTPADPRGRREQLRLAAEEAVAAGPWSWLILRPAAIYGPGRGVHERIRAGRYQPGDRGRNFVSRIHVEDLAVHVEAALFSTLTGAYPVADEEPCTSLEMARFSAGLLGLALPPSMPGAVLHETRRVNRRVDGSAIRRALGIRLAYPSYRVGVPACLGLPG